MTLSTSQRSELESKCLGLRLSKENDPLDSGSLYLLFPLGDDYLARLNSTAIHIQSQLAGDKRLYLLSGCGNCGESADGFSTSGKSNSFRYGRITTKLTSIASCGLYGRETDKEIAGWILREMHNNCSASAVVVVDDAPTSPRAAPSYSCGCLSWLFFCCRKKDEDDFDNAALLQDFT